MRGIFVLFGALALACANPGPKVVYVAPTTPSGKVGLAAEIAAEVEKAPNEPEKALEKRGMTQEDLEALMTDIAADREMSDAYAKARGK